MTRRIVTGLIGFPIIVYIIVKSGVLLRTAILLIVLIGLYEFYGALKIRGKAVSYAGYGAAALYMSLIDKLTANGIIFTVSIFTLVVLALQVVLYNKTTVYEGAIALFGFFYVCFLLSNIYLVREHGLGYYAVWLIVISAWGTDTGAYFIGITMGKHKLTPELSPKKTVEGAVGGVVIATLIGLCYGIIVQKYFAKVDTQVILLSTVIVFFSSIFAQLGDLAASSIKRQTGIKDFGDIIPGHGGIMDRFDSIMFTAPSVYCVLIFFDMFRRIR